MLYKYCHQSYQNIGMMQPAIINENNVLDLSLQWFEILRSKRPKRTQLKLKFESQRYAIFFCKFGQSALAIINISA